MLQYTLPTIDYKVTSVPDEAYPGSDIVIIAVPTSYNEKTESFDLSILDATVKKALTKTSGTVVIKSTIPVGCTSYLCKQLNTDRVIFSPEFMAKGRALFDVSHPSRIIAGIDSEDKTRAFHYVEMMQDACFNFAGHLSPVMVMGTKEAESVKLFANTYLALRVAYFNELDAFAECKGLDTRSIIKGISSDPRIGDGYNTACRKTQNSLRRK